MVVQTIHRLNCLNMVVQTIHRLNCLNMVVQTVQGLNCLNMELLAWFPMSIYVGPCPSLGTSCSTCLIVTNRSHTSRCTTTISCYQTRLAPSLLTPSRDTYTYRRSLPTYQSRNTLNTLKDECLYVRKGPYPKCIRKRTTTTNHGRRTGQRS